MILALVVFLVSAPRNLERFREYQALQLAQRRTTAARLSLEAAGADPIRPVWTQAPGSLTVGAENIGPFPRLMNEPRVRVLFEGERNRFAATVLVQRIRRGEGPELEDNVTTMVCLASPQLNLPAFSLGPASRVPPLAEAALSAVARALRPLVRPGAPPEEEVGFDDPAFCGVYSVRASVASLSEGLASRDIRDVFTPEVRGFLRTRPDWSLEALNDRLLLFRDDVEEPPERIPVFLDEALAMAERFRSPPIS